jgi:hypothetical protein
MAKHDIARALLLLAFLPSCGEEGASREHPGPDTLTLVPADTIGVLAGDSLTVFGEIGDAEYSPSGELVVLDRTARELRFFDAGNHCVRSLGGPGSGPGEFLSPTDFAFLTDSVLAVADWGARTVWLFDDSLEFRGSLGVLNPGSPAGIEPGADGSIVGVGIGMEAASSGTNGESFVGCWTRAGEETVRFASTPIRVFQESEDRIRIEYNELFHAVDRDGRVYVSEASDSLYLILGYGSDGEPVLEIAEPWNRMRRTDAEISTETRLLENQGMENEPSRYRQAVAGLLSDFEGNLWVRLGSVLHPAFLVYSPEGETLFFAECPSLPDTLFDLSFSAGRDGLLAWDADPPDYPKVIRLEFAEGTRAPDSAPEDDLRGF